MLQKLFKLQREGKFQEAQELQGKLAIGEAILGAGGAAVHKVLTCTSKYLTKAEPEFLAVSRRSVLRIWRCATQTSTANA